MPMLKAIVLRYGRGQTEATGRNCRPVGERNQAKVGLGRALAVDSTLENC